MCKLLFWYGLTGKCSSVAFIIIVTLQRYIFYIGPNYFNYNDYTFPAANSLLSIFNMGNNSKMDDSGNVGNNGLHVKSKIN